MYLHSGASQLASSRWAILTKRFVMGYVKKVCLLVENVAKLLMEKGADVNAEGGYYGNALQAASYNGHEAIAKLLIEKGADVNAQGGRYGNALHAASYIGHENVAKLLMEKGADVNAVAGYYGNALQAASYQGHEAIAIDRKSTRLNSSHI